MKTALVTLAIGECFTRMAEVTHPLLQAYASKLGADFIKITDIKVAQTHPSWERFRLYDLLDHYERIIYMDTDILVRPDCPSLFNLVPADKLGSFNQGAHWDATPDIQMVQQQYNTQLPEWRGNTYYNAGLMVLSQRHKPIFVHPGVEHNNCLEQGYLNLVFQRDKVEMHDVGYVFDRFDHQDLPGQRADSYIIHYASHDEGNRYKLMAQDLLVWQDRGLL